MGFKLFGGDSEQVTNQDIDTTEVGISELDEGAIGFVGGDLHVDSKEAVAAVQSIASQALDYQRKNQADYAKAIGDYSTAALLAIGAAGEQSNALAENALFRVAESRNVDVRAPGVLSPGNIDNIIKYGAVVVAALAFLYLASRS